MFSPPVSEDGIQNIFERVRKRFETTPKIMFAGFGQAGKTELFKAVYGEEAEHVGMRTAGKVETACQENFGIDSTETPGIGSAKFSFEKIQEMRVFDRQQIVVQILNGAAAITSDDEALHESIERSAATRITVVNKAELLNEQQRKVYTSRMQERLGLLPKDYLFLSTNSPEDLVRLTRHISESLTDGMQDAFIAQQKADIALKEKRIKSLVYSKATICAATGMIPIPMADILIIAPIQVTMVVNIGYFYEAELSKTRIFELITTLGAGVGLRETARQLVKLIPGYGSLISASIAFAGTVALGESANLWFKNGMKIDLDELKSVFQKAKRKAEREYKQQDAENLELQQQIEELHRQLQDEEITQEEFARRLEELS